MNAIVEEQTTLEQVETLLIELVEIIDSALSKTGRRDTVPTGVIVNDLLDARSTARRLLGIELKTVISTSEEATEPETEDDSEE